MEVYVLSEENKAFIRRVNDEIFNKGNLDLIDQVFASDYVYHARAKQDPQGPELVKYHVKGLRTAFPDLNVTIEPLVAEGDKVAWIRTHSGTHHGEYLGVPPTEKKVSWKSSVISRIVNGKIVEEWGPSNLRDRL